MKFASKSRLLVAAAPISLLALASPSLAQDDAATAATEEEDSTPVIIVTARKREETLLEVPLSITAFAEEAIEEAGFTGLEDISLQSSGFQFSNQGGQQPGRYNTQLRFRGMSTAQFSPTFATGALFVDGVYVLNGGTSLSLVDVERVEVIKGPQSAYFGRNTFGGAVNYITRNPSLTEITGQVEASIDSRGTWDLQGIIEIPLVEDQLSASISGRYYDKRGHFVATDGGRLGNEETFALNGVLFWEPTTNFSVKLRGSYSKDDDGAPAAGFISGDLNDNCTGLTFTTPSGETAMPTNYICGELPGIDEVITATGQPLISSNTSPVQDLSGLIGTFATGVTGPGTVPDNFLLQNLANSPLSPGLPNVTDIGLVRETQRFSLAAEYVLDNDMSIDLLLGYNKQDANWIRDFDLTDRANWFSRDPQALEDYSGELRLTSAQDGRLRWLVGVNYYKQEFTSSGAGGDSATLCFAFFQTDDFANCAFAGFFPNSFTNSDESEVIGLFGSIDFDITDQLTFIAEGRYQEDTLTKGGTLGANGISDDATELKTKNFLPRFILRYQPTPSTNIYASYSEGVLQGDINAFLANADAQELAQYNAQLPTAEVVTPEERLDAWEIGIKQGFANDRIQVNLAGYYYEWTGIKGRSTAVIQETCDEQKLGQDGCTFPGVMLGDLAQIDDGMGGLAPFFNSRNTLIPGDAKLWGIEFESAAQWSANFSTQLNVTWAKNEYDEYEFNFVEPIAGFSNMEGNSQPRFPEWSGNFSSTYTDTLNDDWDWFMRTDVVYFGEAFVDESNLAFTEDYFLVHARLGVESDNLRIEGFVRNLFNEDAYAAGARWTDFSRPTRFETLTVFQGVAVTPQDKRTFGLRVIADF